MFKRIRTKSLRDVVSLQPGTSPAYRTDNSQAMLMRSGSIPTRAKCWAVASLLLFPFTLLASPPAETLQLSDVRVQTVMAVQEEVTANLMRQPEVIGTAIGLDQEGSPALIVYIDRDAPKAEQVVRETPSTIQGTKVEIRFTDKFRAHGRPG